MAGELGRGVVEDDHCQNGVSHVRDIGLGDIRAENIAARAARRPYQRHVRRERNGLTTTVIGGVRFNRAISGGKEVIGLNVRKWKGDVDERIGTGRNRLGHDFSGSATADLDALLQEQSGN